MTSPSEVKTTYSDEVLAIMNDSWIKINLKRCRNIRAMANLKPLSDVQLMDYLLNQYYRKKASKMKRKMEKTKLKNEVVKE